MKVGMQTPASSLLLLLLLMLGSESATGRALSKILEQGADTPSSREKRDSFDMLGILEKYGYLSPVSDGSKTKRMWAFHSEVTVKQGIKRFQEFNRLPVTGKLDAATREKMSQPRCGFPDIIRNQSDPNTPSAYTSMGTKWDNNIITWRATSLSRQLSHPSQIDAFGKAFDLWAEVTPLEFRQTSNMPDIDVSFARGLHSDGYGNAFDGRGGTLAHAFRPGRSALSGDAHFDEDERWSLYGRGGVDLFTVAAHEFGHSLGLGHSRDPGALMAPYYKGYTPSLVLGYDDIRGIQTLYGSKRRPDTTSTTTTTSPPPTSTTGLATPPPTPRPTDKPIHPDICRELTFDAVTMGPDNFAYGFSGKMVYKMADSGVMPGYPRRTRDVFPQAPSNVALAFHIYSKRHTFLLKGSRLWRYTNFRLDYGYPREVNTREFPERPNAALVYPDSYGRPMVLMFGRQKFWEWNAVEERRARSPSLKISAFWRGLPSNIQAALSNRDGYLYFFHGSRYTKVSPYRRSRLPGYPRLTSPAWIGFPCGQNPK